MSVMSLFRCFRIRLLRPLRAYVPSWLRVLVSASAVVSLVLVALGGWWSDNSHYQGLADAESLDAMCQAHLPTFKPVPSNGVCKVQLTKRDEKISGVVAELKLACKRRKSFVKALNDDVPDARRSLKEESVEIREAFSKLRELVGTTIQPALSIQLGLMAFTMGLVIVANYLAGAHAASVGIRRLRKIEQLRTPFVWALCVNAGVAIAVLYWESVDPEKTSYGWDSYCIREPASWLAHAAILGVSVVFAMSLALGWYFSRADLRPHPNADVPRWGVGPYVSFLEIWSFVIVTLTGVLEAVWIHGLAAAPSRTNVMMAFLGAGALAGAGALVGRFVYCAILVRRELEKRMTASPDRPKWPSDPTDGILGQRWWQLPALFVVAGGLAYQLLDSAGVSRLLHGGP